MHRSALLARVLAAAGLGVWAGCTPRSQAEPTDSAGAAVPAASSLPAAPAAIATGVAVLPTGASAAVVPAVSAAAVPAVGAAAVPAVGAAASVSSSALAALTPLPPEATCGGLGRCRENTYCVKPLASAPKKPMPVPFERCAPYSGTGAFSKPRTERQRATTPDVCCYTELYSLPARGRGLSVDDRPRVAPLALGPVDWQR